MKLPLCFVMMPFGKKTSAGGAEINFDAVYLDLIAPAIGKASLEPLRADEEMTGGIIHKPMYERLILCQYAVADLTTANANVFYELGLRHAVRAASTIVLYAEGCGQLPFDVAPLRAIPYRLKPDGTPEDNHEAKESLAQRLVEARRAAVDSPIFQLVEGFPDVQSLKTGVFRDRVNYSEEIKNKLFLARKKGADAVRQVEKDIGVIADAESGVVIDLFLSYRAVKAWDDMIALAGKMSSPLAQTVLVQEQLGFALNRDGRGEEAEKVLLDLITRRGPSSETYGILGRVYKDRWEKAVKDEDNFLSKALLKKAIDAYRKGFETDLRDTYPGINAVTLMYLDEPPDPRWEKLIPIVVYAAERRVASDKPDYWDHATLLELAVLTRNKERATTALLDVLTAVREPWEPETTANNLRLIRQGREKRGERIDWEKDIEDALLKRAKELEKKK